MSHPVTRVNVVETLLVGSVAVAAGVVTAAWLRRRAVRRVYHGGTRSRRARRDG